MMEQIEIPPTYDQEFCKKYYAKYCETSNTYYVEVITTNLQHLVDIILKTEFPWVSRGYEDLKAIGHAVAGKAVMNKWIQMDREKANFTGFLYTLIYRRILKDLKTYEQPDYNLSDPYDENAAKTIGMNQIDNFWHSPITDPTWRAEVIDFLNNVEKVLYVSVEEYRFQGELERKYYRFYVFCFLRIKRPPTLEDISRVCPEFRTDDYRGVLFLAMTYHFNKVLKGYRTDLRV